MDGNTVLVTLLVEATLAVYEWFRPNSRWRTSSRPLRRLL